MKRAFCQAYERIEMNLIDTSALYEILINENFEILSNSFILDLTLYELANAAWKNHLKLKRLSKHEYTRLVDRISQLPFRIIRVETKDMSGITKLAIICDTPIYDAAYLYYANTYNLDLITKDGKMTAAWKTIQK